MIHAISIFLSLIFSSVNSQETLEKKPLLPNSTYFPFPEEANPQIDNGHFTMQLFYMLIMLGLLIGLLLLVSWFFKKIVHSRIQQANANSAIRLLEQRTISARTTIYALDIEGKTYVFAESANALTSLQPVEHKTE
ncbi:MAG: hypothetical protein ACSNEK_02580 [Parachlamydiaceae bacterium]